MQHLTVPMANLQACFGLYRGVGLPNLLRANLSFWRKPGSCTYYVYKAWRIIFCLVLIANCILLSKLAWYRLSVCPGYIQTATWIPATQMFSHWVDCTKPQNSHHTYVAYYLRLNGEFLCSREGGCWWILLYWLELDDIHADVWFSQGCKNGNLLSEITIRKFSWPTRGAYHEYLTSHFTLKRHFGPFFTILSLFYFLLFLLC